LKKQKWPKNNKVRDNKREPCTYTALFSLPGELVTFGKTKGERQKAKGTRQK